MKFVCAVLAAVLFLGLPARADERSDALDKQSYEMYQQVFSPFCPGRSLNDCPSSKAHEPKAEMREKLGQGVPQEQILGEVFDRFGDKYRAVPLFEGVGRWVWLAPICFLLLGLAVATGVAFRRKGSVSDSTRGSVPGLSPELQRQIDDELSKLD